MGDGAERVRVGGGGTRCPYCHDGLDKPAEVVGCGPCGARFHGACGESNGGRCPACGSRDLLLPQRPRARSHEPLPGSRIRVERDESGRATYSWDPRTNADTVLVILFAVLLVTIPLAVLAWLLRRKLGSRMTLTLGDELEFSAGALGTFTTKQVKVRREEVGAVKASSGPNPSVVNLTVDVALERHVVRTGAFGQPLSPPELEWLAEEIRAWAAER